jgi:C4-dicarboxylate-specific signal transduction histidine kinase
MTNGKSQQPDRAHHQRPIPVVRTGQAMLFPDAIPAVEPRRLLSSKSLPLDKNKYEAICRCYRVIYDAFLPGRGSKPFYTQVSEQLLAQEELSIGPRAIARLVARSRELGIDHFPDPSTRAIPSSSPKAAKLQNPAGSLRMPVDEHNAFAGIYRDLVQTWHKTNKRGEGFFAQAAIRMRERGYDRTAKQLAMYAHHRRKIGDGNFPRLRGSQDIERMQIAAVEKMRALGVMATGLMHETLQPLQVILSTAEHQKKEVEKGRVVQEGILDRLDRIITQAKLINEVVQHVRTIARTGEPRIEAVELSSAIQRALTLFGEQLKSRGIEVNLSGIQSNLPTVNADPIALERIFINLITNARDAIEETGRKSGTVSFSAFEREDTVVCEVTDNGGGIVDANLERIFDPYFTTKDVGKGTGIGLTEVFNLMIQFGGRITAANNQGGGATFRLEFQKHVSDN